MRQAEERTRSTFQSVETVVGAFASVSGLCQFSCGSGEETGSECVWDCLYVRTPQ